MRAWLENTGRATTDSFAQIGLGALLLWQSVGWVLTGPFRGQRVRLGAIAGEAMDIGLRALPIVAILSAAVGAMIAIQGIYTLETFGAESQVTLGVALSVTREFAPLITGILIAGRSGSALTARLGMMKTNEEINALTVMGINPVRYLVAPVLIAMLVMVPLVTWFANVVALLGAGLYITAELDMTLTVYLQNLQAAVRIDDLLHGLTKSVIFALLITLIAVVNGLSVTGGAEGIGRATTRAVVQAICAIVVTDMIFAFLATR